MLRAEQVESRQNNGIDNTNPKKRRIDTEVTPKNYLFSNETEEPTGSTIQSTDSDDGELTEEEKT